MPVPTTNAPLVVPSGKTHSIAFGDWLARRTAFPFLHRRPWRDLPGLDSSNVFILDLTVHLPNFPGTDAPVAWKEHQAEFDRSSKDFLVKSLMDHEQGAILVAGVAESPELGRPKKFHEWTAAMNAQHHLNLKLKLMGVDAPLKLLNPPRKISNPAPMIRPGFAEESGVPEQAKSAIDKFCQEWAPLGLQDIIMGNASSDGEFTAMELAVIGQLLANRGSYGQYQFFSPETFNEMRPKTTGEPTVAGEHGLGLHHIRHRRPGASNADCHKPIGIHH